MLDRSRTFSYKGLGRDRCLADYGLWSLGEASKIGWILKERGEPPCRYSSFPKHVRRNPLLADSVRGRRGTQAAVIPARSKCVPNGIRWVTCCCLVSCGYASWQGMVKDLLIQ